MTTPAPETLTEGQKRALELFNEMWNDGGEAGRAMRAKAKEKWPTDVKLPEEAAEPLVAPLRAQLEETQSALKAIREEREAEKKLAEENKAKLDLESALANARNRYNLTDDGFDKMVARMKETGNYTDADAAAAWVAQQTPPPAAPGPYMGPQNLNLFGTAEKDERFALLHADPSGRFLDAEFSEYAKDPRQYVIDAGLRPDW